VIKKGEPIVIERAENGYIVRPVYQSYNGLIDPSSWLVFNDMGVAWKRGDGGVPTLLKYIDEHFTAVDKTASQGGTK